MTRVAILFSVLAIYAVIPSNSQAQETASRDQTGPAAGQSPASALLNRFDKNSDGRRLLEVLQGWSIVTGGIIQELDRQLIDHVAVSPRLEAQTVSAIDRIAADGTRISDHDGVIVKLVRL